MKSQLQKMLPPPAQGCAKPERTVYSPQRTPEQSLVSAAGTDEDYESLLVAESLLIH